MAHVTCSLKEKLFLPYPQDVFSMRAICLRFSLQMIGTQLKLAWDKKKKKKTNSNLLAQTGKVQDCNPGFGEMGVGEGWDEGDSFGYCRNPKDVRIHFTPSFRSLSSVLASPINSLFLCCIVMAFSSLVCCGLSNRNGRSVSLSIILVKVWGWSGWPYLSQMQIPLLIPAAIWDAHMGQAGSPASFWRWSWRLE